MALIDLDDALAIVMYSKEPVESIKNLPSLDLVRCMDCKHRVERGMCYMISGCPELVGVGDHFWCAYGERKVNDG